MSLRKILRVTVKPRARMERVEEDADGALSVRLREAPEDGRANEALIRILAKHLGVPQSALRILRGKTVRRKILELCEG